MNANFVKRGVVSQRRRQSGQALLEMALMTPLLLALALGVIELGRYAYIAILVGSAARAGAMYGAQGLASTISPQGQCPSAEAGIQNMQEAACSDFQNNGQPAGDLTINSSTSCGCDDGQGGWTSEPDCTVTSYALCTKGHWVVTVSVNSAGTFQSLFKYPGIPRSITVDRTATMRVAQQ